MAQFATFAFQTFSRIQPSLRDEGGLSVSVSFVAQPRVASERLVHETSILARAHLRGVIRPTWERAVVDPFVSQAKPANWFGLVLGVPIELSARVLLHDDRPLPDLRSADKLADLDLDDVTPSLPVDD